jgi:maltose alpha-D-glucosyltransferase/alpha-amylase
MKFIEGMPDIEGSRTRSGSRTPMQWDSNINAGFSMAPADKIYIPLDPDPKRPTVSVEDKDPNSLLNYVRSLLSLRASSLAIGNTGDWKLISDVNKPYPMVFMRWGDGEKYIIAINPSDKKVEATISSPGTSKTVFTIGNTSKSSYRIGKKGTDTVLLPPVSAAVYKLE